MLTNILDNKKLSDEFVIDIKKFDLMTKSYFCLDQISKIDNERKKLCDRFILFIKDYDIHNLTDYNDAQDEFMCNLFYSE